ncbi:MAG TPA: aspartate ammonia-lyase [Candidatus Omnitrophota bacterium]|nr:aspartate ammonia-lyase [Candidatus Omnitrophota bacterium]
MEYRLEHDLLGSKEVPESAYWGIHTQRALENFKVSSCKVSFELIRAIAAVKKAACLVNGELNYLSREKFDAILRACEEVMDGKFSDQFPLDALQGGAGTSTHMAVNEVIANRASEILGGAKGDPAAVHPIEEVNLHQSTNDVYPTALKIAAIFALRRLSEAVSGLQGAFQEKEKEFTGIVKIGRTELVEAVPMTLGAEFGGFAEAIGRDRWRTFKCEERLRVVNLGGTAIGTGLGAPRRYIFLVAEKLRDVSGLGLSRAENLPGDTAHADPFVEVSGILKAHACNLVKIANDLRLSSLLGEIRLPELQAGSSIMPGKINPVIPEAVIQAGLKVMANDFLVTEAAGRGTFQINEFMPLLAHALLESLEILIRVNEVFSGHVRGITADFKRCEEISSGSRSLVTAFLPELGYEEAGALLKEFDAAGGKDLRKFLEGKMGRSRVEKVFSPQNLNALGYRDE